MSMRNAILDLQKGRYREAIGAFQMVFGNDVAPVTMRSDALSNAAVCHLRLREWESAEACARAAVEIDPSHVDAWFNLGGSLKEQGRALDALHAFRKTCELRPDRADAWRYRAATAQGLFLWEEAADAWSMASAMGWDPRAFKGRVESLVLGGKAPLVDAETALFLAKNPENDLARYLRILVLADLQRFDEAVLLTNNLRGGPQIDLLVAWVLVNAGHPVEAKALLANLPQCARTHRLRLMLGDGEDLPGLAAGARRFLSMPREDHPDDLADLHFHLGRMADQEKEYPAAWDHYSAAHRLLAQAQPFSEEGHRQLDVWLRLRPWESIEPTQPEDGPQWVFIVGMPRSGTTLLEQILDMHSAFHGAGERHEMQATAQRFFVDGEAEAMTKACATFAQKARDLAPDAAWCIDKMPHNFQFAGMLLHLFPRAYVIWCRRGPLDNCVSIWRQHFRGIHPYAHDLATLGRYYRWHEEIMEIWRSRYAARILEVRYEDVVNDLRGTVTNMLRWFGEKWDPACERFHENPRRILTASKGQVDKPIYRDAVGSWRRYKGLLGPLDRHNKTGLTPKI
ncbi:tetratricopeptide repeat-containing sulfotransferase family protein [Acidithiobacillus ferriphilus]|uniref:tetratricopeptide repeat-containing sulfotransferase family protein n=1 Tax=Acidithiobacillus ferriphilus TaxID=1689834 RepID=UPI002DB66569|nr:sulfotransferase [Acidithiobacillus ferriphilus]MEB8474555.1 sulfotransferase [Acidithiobacillus ferriphilus]